MHDEAQLIENIIEMRVKSFRHGAVIFGVLGFIVGFLVSSLASADPRIYKLDLSYQRIIQNNDPMLENIPGDAWGDAVSMDMGVEVGRFYLDANPHFESAYQKVTAVGLLIHAGFRIFDWLDLEYSHHSRHSADSTNSYSPYEIQSKKYPLFDSAGIVIHFAGNSRK